MSLKKQFVELLENWGKSSPFFQNIHLEKLLDVFSDKILFSLHGAIHHNAIPNGETLEAVLKLLLQEDVSKLDRNSTHYKLHITNFKRLSAFNDQLIEYSKRVTDTLTTKIITNGGVPLQEWDAAVVEFKIFYLFSRKNGEDTM